MKVSVTSYTGTAQHLRSPECKLQAVSKLRTGVSKEG